MLNRAVAVAFEGWKQSVEEVKRNRDIVARVLGKMRMREAAQAYYAWCEVVEERKRNREIVAKIVGKMRMREAAQAYYAWCEMVEERKLNRDIVNKIVGKMRNRELALAFFTWRDAAVEAINERKEMFRKASNFATQLFLDRERHLLMMVFDAWRDQAQSSKHSRFRASLIAARMLNSLLGRCFDAWLDYISIHVVEEKRILRRAAYAIGPVGYLPSCSGHGMQTSLRKSMLEGRWRNERLKTNISRKRLLPSWTSTWPRKPSQSVRLSSWIALYKMTCIASGSPSIILRLGLRRFLPSSTLNSRR